MFINKAAQKRQVLRLKRELLQRPLKIRDG